MDEETEDEVETSFHRFMRFQEFEKILSTPKKKVERRQSDTEHYSDVSDYVSENAKFTRGRGRGSSPA